MSDPTRISLLLSDIDGTLVTPDKVITPRAIAAVQELKRRGVAFAITSSRPPAGLTKVVETLDITPPIAGFNGGLIQDRDGHTLKQWSLDPAIAAKTVARLEAAPVDVWVFQGNTWLTRNPDGARVAHESMTLGYAPTPVTSFPAPLDGVSKIVGSVKDYAGLGAVAASLAQELGPDAAVSMSQLYYIDVTHPQANKGSVLLALSELLGIPTAEIAAIGDGDNDTYMFAKAGLSIAMGNGTPAVQARAQKVTAPNTAEGFAEAVERFILPLAAG